MWGSVLSVPTFTICWGFPSLHTWVVGGRFNRIFTPISFHPLIPMLSKLHHQIRRKKPVEIDYGIMWIHAVMAEIQFSSFLLGYNFRLFSPLQKLENALVVHGRSCDSSPTLLRKVTWSRLNHGYHPFKEPVILPPTGFASTSAWCAHCRYHRNE